MHWNASDWPPVVPPLSMAFLTFSWSSQRRLENPSMSEVDWAAARCQKQEKWCQCGTFPSNMGDCRGNKEQRKYHDGCITALLNLLRHVARKTRWGNTQQNNSEDLLKASKSTLLSTFFHCLIYCLGFFDFDRFSTVTITMLWFWNVFFFGSCSTRSHALYNLEHACKHVCARHFEDRQCAITKLLALCEQDSTDNASHLNAKPGPKSHC